MKSRFNPPARFDGASRLDSTRLAARRAARTEQCFFCTSNIKNTDYKDQEALKRFLDPQSRILPRRRSWVCATPKRNLARAVKGAWIWGPRPFVSYCPPPPARAGLKIFQKPPEPLGGFRVLRNPLFQNLPRPCYVLQRVAVKLIEFLIKENLAGLDGNSLQVILLGFLKIFQLKGI